jgi:hypothetical protein
MFSVKNFFLKYGAFYEVFSALLQVMNVELNRYPLHPLRVCCNYVGFNVTVVAWITRTVIVMQFPTNSFADIPEK